MPRSELLLVLFQGLNMFAWVAWLGGLTVGGYIVIKTIAGLPPPAGRAALEHFTRIGKPVVSAASCFVMVSAIFTAVYFGPIDSVWSVYATWYGRTALCGLVIAGVMFLRSRRRFSKLNALLWDQNNRLHPQASTLIRNGLVGDLFGFGAILACFDLMTVGL